MALGNILSNEKEASSGAKPALEKLAASLESLDILSADGFVTHVKSMGEQAAKIYGELPPFPEKPASPYSKNSASGDLPTHDSVTDYEEDIMFYRNECKAFARALAKNIREKASV